MRRQIWMEELQQMLYCADQRVTIASYSIVAVKSDSGHNKKINRARPGLALYIMQMQMQPVVFN